MFESYQVEVIKKRRAARLFWLIVFVCALFLYFFFQGYYPDIRVGLRHILEPNNTYTGSTDIMRSFGIINVRSTQIDATILLGSGSYGNNEKRMSDYGDYTMRIEKPGYLINNLEFVIDREKPYFIEKMTLLPQPTYQKLKGILGVYPMKNGDLILKTASGFNLSGSTITHSGSLEYIGNKYFHSGTGVLVWEGISFEKANQTITNFVQTCKNLEWKYNIFYCPKSRSLLTEGGIYMTGVLDIYDNLIEKSGAILQIVDGNIGKSWTQSGVIDLRKVAILNGVFYTNNSGTLIPTDISEEIITTPFDTIEHIARLGDDVVFIGIEKGKLHIIIRRSGDPLSKTQDIKFPEQLSSVNIKFHSLDGNIMVETSHGILFVYGRSQELHWIVEGEILSYNDNGAIYRKDDEIWSVDWREKI